MACNGDCSNCGDPCGKGISLLERFKQDQKNKENSNTKTKEVVMSEAVGGCHAGNEEKIGRLDERNNGCKLIASAAVVAALVAVIGVWYLNGKINQVKFESAVEIEKVKTSSEIKISNLEKEVEELKKEYAGMKEYAEDGRRAYEAAKKFRQRHKD